MTFGGGEPLAQWDVARTLADRLREEGVHVAIDTACVASPSAQQEVPGHVDLVLVDLKLVRPEEHRHWTGAGNARILETIRHWSREMPGRLWVSVPLIPGVHDEAEIVRIARFVSSLANHPPVRLIPYHRLGEGKYAALGRDVPQFPGEVEPLIEAARSAFNRLGVRVLERG